MTHWHWQNLNERKGETRGLGIVHGRAKVWVGDNKPNSRGGAFGVEWCFSRRFQIGARVERGGIGGERDASGSVSLGWFTLYAHTERAMPRWWLTGTYEEKEYGLAFSWEDWRVSWKCGGNPMSWSSRDPWWKNGSKSLKDLLLGRQVYREGAPETHRIVVKMPEGSYTGTCVMRDDSWKRRLWFRQVIRRADINMDEGQQIPHPGKGENSWDCGMDGLFGMCCPAETVDEAIEKARQSSFRDRLRYGGPNWTMPADVGA